MEIELGPANRTASRDGIEQIFHVVAVEAEIVVQSGGERDAVQRFPAISSNTRVEMFYFCQHCGFVSAISRRRSDGLWPFTLRLYASFDRNAGTASPFVCAVPPGNGDSRPGQVRRLPVGSVATIRLQSPPGRPYVLREL